MSDGDYEEFRRRVRDWLAEHAVALLAQDGAVPNVDDGHDADSVAAAKEFQGKLHAAGLAGLTWPAEAGGQGLDARYEIVFQQEAADYALPTSLFNIGTGMCGPTIIAHGTSEQRDRWLAPILRGEQVWCQLFSEPDAGSDLAAVRSRAARADGGWLVNGQKIWTSHGRFADFGLALLRSDPQRPKHHGLMMAVIDMKATGVEVRPLRQMTGLSKFDQVYLDNVFVRTTRSSANRTRDGGSRGPRCQTSGSRSGAIPRSAAARSRRSSRMPPRTAGWASRSCASA
jgi:alkylation response protein AidB-like acyl-CoA dehydrogenase